ncbi:MAG: tRNA methyl transferase PRC-barrel domain-containing protein [Patescibacteria group bacterium]
MDGHKIGEHTGAYFYTIGQRRGIELGGGPALFVIKKDVANNTITVGPESALELAHVSLTASGWHTVAPQVKFPLDASCKIRYRQKDIPVHIESL